MRGQRGSVLMATLVFFVLAFIMVSGWVSSWLVHERTLNLQQEHMQNIYLLDSGVMWARDMLSKDPHWRGDGIETPAGKIEAVLSREGPGLRELYVRAETANGTATVRLWLDQEGRPVMWREVADVLNFGSVGGE